MPCHRVTATWDCCSGVNSDRVASLLLWVDTVQDSSFSFALVVNEGYLETPVTRIHMLQTLIKPFVSMAQWVSLGISEAGSLYARTAHPVQLYDIQKQTEAGQFMSGSSKNAYICIETMQVNTWTRHRQKAKRSCWPRSTAEA